MKTNLICLLLLLPWMAKSQPAALQELIQTALANNLALQEKKLEASAAEQSLQHARKLFLPGLDFASSYVNAEGGRNSILPLGDMMNPVYATLNQLTQSQSFPTLENQRINFLPQNYYDLHLRLSAPILNYGLIQNQKIEQAKTEIARYDWLSYQRDVIRSVKEAYYKYQMASEAVKIYNNALVVLQKAVQVNESLLRNGSGLQAQVLRSRSEVLNLESKREETLQQQRQAARYLNFLLNRDLESPIAQSATNEAELRAMLQSLNPEPQFALREELLQLEQATLASREAEKLQRNYWVPKLSGFADIGSQSDNLQFDREARYFMVGASLDMSLFAFGRNQTQMKKAKTQTQIRETQYQQAKQAFSMEEKTHRDAVNTQLARLNSAKQQHEAAKAYFNVVDKAYREGIYSQIEWLDAQNQATQAELNIAIQLHQTAIALAQLERSQASSKTLPIK